MGNAELHFEAKTVQTANIKVLFEVLKKILSEVNMIITSEGIKIVSINELQISLVFLKLRAENFEYYSCPNSVSDPIVFGVYTENMFKIMKSVKHDETISFFTDKPDMLYIKKENDYRNSVSKYSLDLHYIPFQNLEIEDVEYSAIISMGSTEFNKLCKDYSQLGCKVLEIRAVGQKLMFQSVGDVCKSESVYGNSQKTVFNLEPDAIIQGRFDLEYLLLFSKACNLSKTVEIYMKNDAPLLLQYKIGTLGEIKFMISPTLI